MNDNSSADVNQVRAEHDEIHSLAETLLRMMVERQESPVRVRRLCEELRDHLSSHFENEEREGGLLDQLSERDPEQINYCAKIRDEHKVMLAAIAEIILRADTRRVSVDWWETLAAEFRIFFVELDRHEHAENELIQQLFEQTSGVDDPSQ